MLPPNFLLCAFRADMYVLLLNVEVKLLGHKHRSPFRIYRCVFWRIVPIYAPTSRAWDSQFSTSLQPWPMSVTVILAILAGISQYLLVLLHWFLWWMSVSPFSYVYWPFIYLFSGVPVCLLAIFYWTACVFLIGLLVSHWYSNFICISNFFSHFVTCLITLPVVSSGEQKFLILT